MNPIGDDQHVNLDFDSNGTLLPMDTGMEHSTRSLPSSKLESWSFKARIFLKQAAGLLIFHHVNAVVAIAGTVLAMLFLASVALVLCWSTTLWLLLALVELTNFSVSFIPSRPSILRIFGYFALIGVLVGLAVLRFYELTGLCVLMAIGLTGPLLFTLVTTIMPVLVREDARLAAFVGPMTSFSSALCANSEVCIERFVIRKSIDRCVFFPLLAMTPRAWVGFLYFAVLKVTVGLLSVGVLLFAVAEPVWSIINSGKMPFLIKHASFHDDPIVRIGSMVFFWALGTAAMPTVATLSVKLTLYISGEWESDQGEMISEHDQKEDGAGISSIPEAPKYEPRAPSFVQVAPGKRIPLLAVTNLGTWSTDPLTCPSGSAPREARSIEPAE
ncbi:hypothetical protein PHYPSEUDO_001040 [Phytophthora pseudosyringae]|uniref:Transmembrane protein n=1 Tax=Phytophthora pseudosyringae TaxID=221518 RepID=A0A8T1VWU2_9STRA|nr:hypothetical protein PHYPSEUDO_001040 [Phytophthora pseudosyringae]